MRVRITHADDDTWYGLNDEIEVLEGAKFIKCTRTSAEYWYYPLPDKPHLGVDINHCKRVYEKPVSEKSSNKYSREIKPSVFVDVYDVLRAWEVTDPCLQHLLKKALATGKRGHKSTREDLQDILASAKRALEMYEEWEVNLK